MLLLIDNYDSFTYNLVQYCQALGVNPLVIRNDALSVEALIRLKPARLLVSPGPCTPNEAGVSLALMRHFYTRIPVLGVCLGHQALVQTLGGQIERAREVMHGKVSAVSNDGSGVFKGLPPVVRVTRYHSLVASPASLPACLKVNAWVTDYLGNLTIMGVQHEFYPVAGVQFHPESIASEFGHEMLANFLQW